MKYKLLKEAVLREMMDEDDEDSMEPTEGSTICPTTTKWKWMGRCMGLHNLGILTHN